MIEVPAADFIPCNGGLVKLLTIIADSGPQGISTRQLCEQSFNSRNYSLQMIQKAEQERYIKRIGSGKKREVVTEEVIEEEEEEEDDKAK
jgi:hypothetical protein